MIVDDLKVGMVVIFSKIPNGSYLSTDTKYLVEYVGKRDISFRNVVKGSGTFDSRRMLGFAKFEVAA